MIEGASLAMVILPPEVVCPAKYRFLYCMVGEPKSYVPSRFGPILPATSNLNGLLSASRSTGAVPIPKFAFWIIRSPEEVAVSTGSLRPVPEENKVILPSRDSLVPHDNKPDVEFKKKVEPSGVPSPPNVKSSVRSVGRM